MEGVSAYNESNATIRLTVKDLNAPPPGEVLVDYPVNGHEAALMQIEWINGAGKVSWSASLDGNPHVQASGEQVFGEVKSFAIYLTDTPST